MKKIAFASLAVIVVAVSGWYFFLKEPHFDAVNGYLVNVNKQGVIIEGYDPVAYFTDNKPVMGNAQYSAQYEGGTYWFASAEHATLFKNDPKKYAPQYGAFCGYAVSVGKLRPVDPTIYQIESGRLILQHTQEAYNLFNKDLKQSVVKADKNWPELVSSHVGKPVEYDKPAQASTNAASK
jgi:YHS domain-containing protein